MHETTRIEALLWNREPIKHDRPKSSRGRRAPTFSRPLPARAKFKRR